MRDSSRSCTITSRSGLLMMVCAMVTLIPHCCLGETVWDVVKSRPELSKISRLITIAGEGFAETLHDKSVKLTIFLPHNDAFNATYTPVNYYQKLTAGGASATDKNRLIRALMYITVGDLTKIYRKAGLIQEAGTDGWLPIKTYYSADSTIFYSSDDSGYINGARFVEADVSADNGIIHIVDRFLSEAGATRQAYWHIAEDWQYKSERQFSSLLETYHKKNDHKGVDAKYALSHGDLVTLFYPTDQALNNLRQKNIENMRHELVESHLVTGAILHTGFIRGHFHSQFDSFYSRKHGGQPIITFSSIDDELYVRAGCTQARIINANITVSNGVIHIIDGVLGVKQDSVLDVVGTDGMLKVFRKYLDVSDVKTKIQSDASTTQYTIFAPNNDAWGSDDLSLEQDIERLNEVIEMHVIEGDVFFSLDKLEVPVERITISGVPAHFTKDSRHNVFVEVGGYKARIVSGDGTCAKNGVVYMTDRVLGTAVYDAQQYMALERDSDGLEMYSEFQKTLDRLGLTDLMGVGGRGNRLTKVTVFAPTNKAFEAMRRTTRGRDLLDNNTNSLNQQMTVIMKRHFLQNQVVLLNSTLKFPYKVIGTGNEITKRQMEYHITDGHYDINITTPNIGLTNGVLHKVDGVMYHEDPSLDSSASSVPAFSICLICISILHVYDYNYDS